MKDTKKNIKALSNSISALVEKLKAGGCSCEDFTYEVISTLEVLNPDKIHIIWDTADILAVAKEEKTKISKNLAQEILHNLKHHHDASSGINWDIIREYIRYP